MTFIPPVIALAMSAGWIGSQRHTISTVERESELLQTRISAARKSNISGKSNHGPSGAAKTTKRKEAMDWKKIATDMAEMNRTNGMSDMRSMIRLQQKIQSMSREELLKGLKEIAALDLSAEERGMLEQMLMGPLVEKDPEYALVHFIDRLGDDRGGFSWQLSNALQLWAKKDPARASAWFDGQIAAGKFDSKALDGRNRMRNQFESSMIYTLLGTDAAAAAGRLSALPAEQRSEVLNQFSFRQLPEEDQAAFAKMVRDGVPEKQQGQTLAGQVPGMVGQDGYEKVTGYLDRISATPEERAACVEQAGEARIRSLANKEKVTAEQIDKMREWASAEAPGSADRATGKALASVLGGRMPMKFDEAADLAVKYHEASGNDDVLVSFLETSVYRGNKSEAKDRALELARKISDETRRNKILEMYK